MMPPYFFPEQMSSTHLDQDRFEAYSKNNIYVEVITPTPTRGIDLHTREKYKNIKNETLFDGHVRIHRFSMFREGKNPLLRAARYFISNIIQYKWGIKAKKVDVIYSGSTPPIQGLLCGRVKRVLSKKYGRKVPFVYCLQDIFPDSLVNANMTQKGSVIWKIGRKIENYTYKKADRIIVISDAFKQNLLKKGVSDDKIVVIPNWINLNEVYPVDRNKNVLFDRYNLNRNKFYICYSGNIGHSQNLGLLLKAAIKLQKKYSDICFVLIGEGAAKEDLLKIIKEKRINNIIVLPFQPYEDIAHVFSLGDAGLIISKDGIGSSSVPSKTWSIMAAGKPIIASFDLNSELSRLLYKENCGLCTNPNDVDSFIDSIKEIKRNPVKAKSMGQNGLTYIYNNLSKEKCVSDYIKVLKTK